MNTKILEFSKTMLVHFLPIYLITLEKFRKKLGMLFSASFDRRKVNQVDYVKSLEASLSTIFAV